MRHLRPAGKPAQMCIRDSPHAPENHRPRTGRIEPRHFADRIGGNAADRRHEIGAVACDVRHQFRITQSPIGDEFRIDQIFLDDDVHHRVQQRHVGIGFELQVTIRSAGQLTAPRVHDDEFGAAAHGILEEARRDRMVDRGIGADQNHDARLGDIHHRIADRAGADALQPVSYTHLDKLVGENLLAGRLPLREHIILLSGRASFELVQKALRTGAAVLAAIGAPSSLAVNLAVASGLTLVGFLREKHCNVYSNPERLTAAH